MISPEIQVPPWLLTEKAFHRFLAQLHPDRDQAGVAYEELRLKLNYFFEARHCVWSEMYADETINRMIRKISEGEQIQNLNAYAFQIARYVHLESQRTPVLDSLEDHLPEDDRRTARNFNAAQQEIEEGNFRHDCMIACLAKLPSETRGLLIEYYQGNMAQRRGMTANALYIQVHRIREKLEECLFQCLKNR
jgi:DNA-directed RNA polymerase specialized sigma24 family protein